MKLLLKNKHPYNPILYQSQSLCCSYQDYIPMQTLTSKCILLTCFVCK